MFISTTGIALSNVADPPVPNLRGCFVVQSRNAYVVYIFLAWFLYDLGAAILFLIPAIAAFRQGFSKLVTVFYRDGAIYVVVMLCLSVVNIVVVMTFPRELSLLLAPFERVMHLILTSRMIIHIREIAASRNVIPRITEPGIGEVCHTSM
ncbi:hypothetical protein VNI00_010449 [Paramarasmius palmivorus]|uniref:Uncharacterized protein n=1 Tax=Paramarasmius palmivorus TaxID=297713 RepID=A0AAW0CKA6_9AGAR